MTKTFSLLSALLCTFIWGTTFIAQDTGMDKIGPLTFNGARFLIGFLFIIPIALIYENSKIIKQLNNIDKQATEQIKTLNETIEEIRKQKNALMYSVAFGRE